MAEHVSTYLPNTWHHVYNRGVDKQSVFRRAGDERAFLDCFARHLGPAPEVDSRGRPLRHFRDAIALSAYCLMPNHFHLLVWVGDDPSLLAALMKSATAAYGRYFNQRHGRDGPLWRGRFRSKPLPTTGDVMRVTAYIHLNMRDDPDYRWSSHRYFVDQPAPEWLDVDSCLKAFGGLAHYERFIEAEQLKRERQRDGGADLADWLSL